MLKAINKVVYGGNTIIDLTDLTVDQDKLLRGYTARRADGNKVTGTVDQTIEYLQVGGTVTKDENDYLEFDDSGGITPTGTIVINQNGIVDVTNYASANVNVDASPILQDKTGINPSTSSQTITADSGYDGLSSVQINAMPTVMNVQAYAGYDSVNSGSYIDTDVTLTVAKSGTYTISWMGWRNTTSGTSGSQLYKNGTAVGTAHTSFLNNYGQSVVLTGQSLNQEDVLVVRARSRNTSYYMAVGNLIIEQTS